jgi:BirA family biotin operon repressor/biotin-[acetyl-CoA-carboxylase] ligase
MSAHLDGLDAVALAARWQLPAVHIHDRVLSTMDLAHEAAAAGARPGTLVLAHEQYAGRGRSGGQWHAAHGGAVLVTLIERPSAGPALEVLSLRVGLALAHALEPFARTRLRVKWPNDVHDADGKVAGVLIEVRWREQQPEWVAIGIGVNVSMPPTSFAGRPSSLGEDTSRIAVLDAILPSVRAAVAQTSVLRDDELAAWGERDLLLGRHIVAPVDGVVAGIAAAGDLLVDTPTGRVACRAGSVQFKEA